MRYLVMRVSLSLSLSLSSFCQLHLFSLYFSFTISCFFFSAFDALYSRSYTIYYHHNFVVVVYILLIIVGTVNNNISHSVPTDDRKLRASGALEQHACNNCGDLLIQNLAHHQSEQARLVLEKESPVVRMPGQIEQRASRAS